MNNSGQQAFDPQHQQKLEELIAIAKEQGFLTYEEINEVLPMNFDTPELIDQVLIFLSGMDIQILNQAEVERQRERKKEAKELETLPKRPEGSSDDPVRMYLKEMGSVPLLTREEEVEISKRIEKAQIQIERIIMRFRYSVRETISIIQYLISGKERFDKIVTEKEIKDKQAFSNMLSKLCSALTKENDLLQDYLEKLADPLLKKVDQVKINEDIEKCRIRTQAFLRRMHFRHNIIDDFGEVILAAYNRFLQLEKEIQELVPRAEKNRFAAAKLLAARRKLSKRELAGGRTLDEFKKDVRMLQRWMDKNQEAKREMVESNLRLVISIAKKYTNR
ncbi:MAG: RNA polymerase subunit sigma, partial [Chlamydiae bacterium]|nr:RNA polymerase subunit sigma [Chlamydiota bacterium]